MMEQKGKQENGLTQFLLNKKQRGMLVDLMQFLARNQKEFVTFVFSAQPLISNVNMKNSLCHWCFFLSIEENKIYGNNMQQHEKVLLLQKCWILDDNTAKRSCTFFSLAWPLLKANTNNVFMPLVVTPWVSCPVFAKSLFFGSSAATLKLNQAK